ncbi:MAG: adenylate/guanylate cyclase domain-containing protein [Alphaproteobacteria bacterium]
MLLTLVGVFTNVDIDHHHETHAAISLSAYGVVTIAALFVAWRQFYHPSFSYLWVTIDVALVATHLLLLVQVLDLPHAMAYSIPASGLLYFVLVHAALRFRAGLVLYAAALFVGLLEGGRLFLGSSGEISSTLSPLTRDEPFLAQHVLPLSILSLTAFALWALGRETRRMLTRAIDQASRVANLSRFFSPAVADRVASAGRDSGHGERLAVAILFVDMRGFSRTAQELSTEQLVDLLVEFRQVVTAPVFELGGTVDKFVGDGALIVFGSPDPQLDAAARAIKCGHRILEAVADWSQRRSTLSLAPIKAGIGGHYGEVFAGVLGSGAQSEFTVIGDAVNVTERIERVTRLQDADFVVSGALLGAAGSAVNPVDWKLLDMGTLPDHGASIRLFSARPGERHQQQATAT